MFSVGRNQMPVFGVDVCFKTPRIWACFCRCCSLFYNFCHITPLRGGRNLFARRHWHLAPQMILGRMHRLTRRRTCYFFYWMADTRTLFCIPRKPFYFFALFASAVDNSRNFWCFRVSNPARRFLFAHHRSDIYTTKICVFDQMALSCLGRVL